MDLAELVAAINIPMKELSDWNFSMEEFLEKYHAILDKNSEVDFLKAGIILETLSCVYSRRVDSLHEGAISWKTNHMEETELAEQEKSKTGKSRKSRKLCFDLDDFEELDFEKDCGKNINMKSSKKSVKLLHRQFSQLESNRAEKNSEMLDVNGEIIGKVYSFRINQPVTRSGMLVKQLTPKCYIVDSGIMTPKNMATTKKVVSPQASLGYHSEFSEVDIDSEIEPTQIISESQSKTPEPFKTPNHSDSGFYEMDKTLDEGIEIDGKDDENLGEVTSADHADDTIVVNDLHVEKQEENVFSDTEKGDDENPEEENEANETELGHDDEDEDDNEKVEETENALELEKDENEQSLEKIDENANVEVEKEAGEVAENDESEDKNEELANETIDNSKREKNELEENPRKRRKTKLVCVVDENKKWEPIPFEEGVPNRKRRSQKKFRLPCHIDILKKTPKKRKLLMERGETVLSKVCKKNLSKNLDERLPSVFNPLDNDEINDYIESLDSIGKGKFPSMFSTILQGYQKKLTTNNVQMDSPISCTSYDGYTVEEPEPPEEPELNFPEHSSYNTPPATPFLFEPTASSSAMGSRIGERFSNEVWKKKVTERLGKADQKSELEKNVAKWHETLRPKLAEAEKRPSFTMNHYKSKIEKALLESEGKKMAFKDVVKNRPVSEVARFFLSSLQMANMYSVDFRRSPDHELELALLETKKD